MMAVVRKFFADRASRLAAVVAYYGFFSLFPLLLVAATIVGFVFAGDSAAALRNSVLNQIPVLGRDVGAEANQLHGNGFAIAVGVATALWAGTACMAALQDAMNNVWAVPRGQQPSFFRKRLRSVVSLGILGLTFAVTLALSQVIALAPDIPGLGRALGAFGSVVVNCAAFWLTFKYLSALPQRWRVLLPGAVVAGIGYSLLQLVGRLYVQHVIAGATDTYGTFAVVIGLLSWLHLLALLTLIAAEVNVVATRA